MKRAISGFVLALVIAWNIPLPAADITPPQLVSLSLSTTNLEVSESNQTIQVTARITDDLSGFGIPPPFTAGSGGGASAVFTSPSGRQSASVGLGPSFPSSGVVLETGFTNSMNLPRYSEPGLWLLRYVAITDKAGNHRQLDLATIRNLGLPYSFMVEEFPLLNIALSESTAIVSWPAYASAFVLQTSASCSAAAVWGDVFSAPIQIGEEKIIASPLSAGQRFYRLIKRP
jgi:hypothetical protein